VDDEGFWAIIDESLDAVGFEATPEAQATWLTHRLEQLEADEIQHFDQAFWKKMIAAYRWDLWGVCNLSNGHGGQEGFMRFRAWLVSRGRAVFEAALADPDSLAEHIHENVDGERVTYCMRDAYQQKMGSELPTSTLDLFAEPRGEAINPSDLTTRFPRVAAALDKE